MDFDEFKKAVVKAYNDGVVNSSVNGVKFVNAENYFAGLYGNGFCVVEECEVIDIFNN